MPIIVSDITKIVVGQKTVKQSVRRERPKEEKTFEEVKQEVAAATPRDPQGDHPLLTINNQKPTTVKRSPYMMDMLTSEN